MSSQIPAIQQLYNVLTQGLEGQRGAALQTGLEGAAERGILRSTITGDIQSGIEQQFLQQQGQLQAQQLGEIGDIRNQIAGIGVEQAQAVANLADTLQQRNIEQQRLTQERQAQSRQLSLQRQLANRQYQLDKQRIARGY